MKGKFIKKLTAYALTAAMVVSTPMTAFASNKYYKIQNSWDTNQLYDGFMYVSVPFFLAKTMDIMVHKDAVPANIASKFKN